MADEHIDTAGRVETPEHIAFEFRLAGPWRRGIAYLLDLLVRLAGFIVCVFLLSLVSMTFIAFDDMAAMPIAAMLLLYFVVEWFYFVLFEWLWQGRTPGKRALGLRVVKEAGLPVGLGDALLRNLLRAADLLPPIAFGVGFPTYLVGALVSAGDPKFRRLGDLAAGTIVIVEEPARLRVRAPIEPPPTPGEIDVIPAHPRLRIEEKKTLDAFMRRFRTIHPARREELCDAWAKHLAKRLGSPTPKSGARYLQLVYARLSESSGRDAPKRAR